jgi:hypothetical protein
VTSANTICWACVPGKFSNISGSTTSANCINCEAGKYSNGGVSVCTDCVQGSTSPIGSTAITSCVCKSGFVTVSTNPLVCEQAACTAGSTGPSGSCTQCVPGKYKTVSGSAPCDDCLAGKYSAATGASTAATCLSCSAGSYAGTPGSFACSLCPSGKYSAVTGASTSTTCQDCSAGKYSAATGASTAATCQNCAAGSYAATQASSACSLCPSGKYSNAIAASTTCQDCLAGKYSAATGASTAATCQNCSAGSYSTSTGATLEAACLVCPIDTNSPSGSATLSNCSCNTGYFGPNGGPCTFSYINFARQCASGDCKVTGISEYLWPEDGSVRKLSRLVDGEFIENKGALTSTGQNDWLMIDLEQKRSVSFIRIYNRPDASWYLNNFQIRIGDSSTFANNPACVTGEP